MNHPARATDLSTSHEAARYVVQSGLQGNQQAAAASAVKRHPGLTSLELAGTGRVWRGPKKPCSVSGRSACTWWPVAPGENLTLGL